MDGIMALDAVVPLLVAALLGGSLGIERELRGQAAGLRTHMLVAMGAAVFVLVGVRGVEGHSLELSRVIQGIAAGVGFIGAGAILKLTDRGEIVGLTTASSVWMAAAVGTAAGVYLYTLAATATVIALVVLAGLYPLELRWLARTTAGAGTVSDNAPPGRPRRK